MTNDQPPHTLPALWTNAQALLNRWMTPPPALADNQLRLLYANSPNGLLASMALATVVVATHWPVIAPTLLLAWWIAMALLTAVRTTVIIRYRRSGQESASSSPWLSRHLIGTLCSGLAWGAAGILLFTPDSTEHQTFLCLAITGMVAGAVPIHAASRAAFLAFALPASLPLIAQLLLLGDPIHLAMGTTGLIFLGIMSSLAWTLNRGIRQTIELDAERTQAETQLFDLFARTNDLIQSVAPDGRLLFVNRAWQETLGYSAAETASMNIFDVLHPDGHEHCRNFMQRILAGENVGPVELMFRTKSGRTIVAEGQVSLRLEHGLPAATRGIFRDITERKIAEARLRMINQNLEDLVTERTGKLRASEQLFRTLAQVSPVGIFHTDATGRCLYVNNRWCEITGLSAESAAGDGWSASLHPDDRERVGQEWIEAARAGHPFKSEYRFQMAEGLVTWVVGQAQAEFDQHNRLTGYVGTITDITDRKQAEQDLREREEYFRSLIEHSSDIITLLDLDGAIQFQSPSFQRIFGYDHQEVNGRSAFEFIHPDDLPNVLERFHLIIQRPPEPQSAEFRFRHKDGSWRYLEGIGQQIRTPHGQTAVIVNSRDMTERKLAEQTMREQAALLDRIFAHSLDCLVLLDKNYNFIRVSDSYARVCQRPASEFPGHNHFEYYPSSLKEEFDEALRQGITYNRQARPFSFPDHPEWGITYWDLSLVPIHDHIGQVEFLLFTLQDVTVRERAETALKESLQFLQSIIQTTPTRVFWKDRHSRYLGCNQLFARDAGVATPSDIVGKDDSQLPWRKQTDVYHADDQQVMESGIAKLGFEEWQTTPDGRSIWLRISKVPLRNNAQEIIGILGVYDDITDRKEADFALQQSIERFDLAVQASRDGLWDIYLIANDPFNNDNPIYYSPRMKEIMEVGHDARTDVLGTWTALLHPDDRERIFAALTAHLTRHSPYDVEYRIITNNGTTKWIAAKGQAQWSESGIPIRMSGSFSDITQRKQAEEQLRLTQVTMDRLSEAIFWIDQSARICYVNDSACRMLGYSQKELLALSVPDIDPHFPADAWPAHWAELQQRGSFTFESSHRTKSGSIFQTEVTVNYLEFGGKEFNCAIMRDVTNRKQTEEAMQFLSSGIARLKGEEFFGEMALQIAKLLQADIGFVGKLLPLQTPRIRVVGFALDGQTQPPVEYSLAHTPCEQVIGKQTALFHDSVQQLFPEDQMLADLSISSYAAIPLFDSTGRAIGHVGMMSRSPLRQTKPIIDLLRLFAVPAAAELERQRTEAKFRDLFEFSPDAVIMVNQSGFITLANQQAESLFGYSQAELHGLPVEKLMPESDRQGHVELRQQFIATATPRMMGTGSSELYARKKNGTVFPIDINLSPIQSEEGLVVAAAVRDISERKLAEQALRDNRELLNSILDSTPSAVFALDRQQRFTLLNNVLAQLFGLPKDEVVGKTLHDVFPRELADRMQLANNLILASGTSQFTEEAIASKDGHQSQVVLSSKFPLRNAQGDIVGLGTVSTDITDYKHAEQALAESEERFRILFEQAAVGVAQIDAVTGHFVRINRKFCAITGYDQAEMLTREIRDITHPDDWTASQHNFVRLLAGEVREFMLEQRYRHKNGTIVWVKLVVSPMWQPGAAPDYTIAVVQDITERKQAEESLQVFQEQIRQMQKQEALGQLAGGIAHDFNNLLTAILGNAEIAKAKVSADHPSRPSISRILEAGSRASHLVQQILAFTHQQELSRTVQPLPPLITEVLALLRATLPAGVALTSTFDAATPPVLADATQLHQVVMNLCTNAWHALKDQPGTITVRLEPVTLTQPLHSLQRTLQPGLYAKLSVHDTGCGMDEQTIERIFDPFFTTKPVGQGTGLGLSVVHGIIQGHEGAITVESQPGQGTTFSLYFPAATAQSQADRQHESTTAQTQGQGRHLLYLDDEAMLVELVTALFEPLGYRVTGLTNPTEAIEAIRAHPNEFDLMVTDFNMPEMSGLDVAKAIAQIRADLPIVLVSGYLSPSAQADAIIAQVKEIVYKPTMLQQLSQVVARLLNLQPPAS